MKCSCGGTFRKSMFTGRMICPFCSKPQPDQEFLRIILIHNGEEKIIGDCYSPDTTSWFAQAFKNDLFPLPDYNDQLEVRRMPDGKVIEVYRLGWLQVEPIKKGNEYEEPPLPKEPRIM